MRYVKAAVLGLMMCVCAVAHTSAQIIDDIGGFGLNYQGTLNQSGTPAPDGLYPMEFRIFEQEVGGTEVWMEPQMVQVTDGRFDVILGKLYDFPFPPFFITASPRWLEVTVNGETLTPRTELTAAIAAYAAGRVRGDIMTAPGNLDVSDADCPDDTCPHFEASAMGGMGSWTLGNRATDKDEVSVVIQTEIISMDFTYDDMNRLAANVTPDMTGLSMATYSAPNDTAASYTNLIGNGTVYQNLHVPTPAGGMNCITDDIDASRVVSGYSWEMGSTVNAVTLEADSGGAKVTIGDPNMDDGWLLDFQNSPTWGNLGLWAMDTEILKLSGSPSSTSEALYHRIPEGDSISGILEEADANGARLMVSDYGNGEATLEADSGGSALILGLQSVEPFQVDLHTTSNHAGLGFLYDERDLIGLHATPQTSAQSVYFRIPAGDSTSGISQTADMNGARLMVSDYGVGGTDGISLSTGSSGSLISVSGVGSGGVPGLVLRDDRVRLGSMSTAIANTVAMGNRAKANHAGSMVLADMSAMDLTTSAPDQLLARFAGGATIYSNATQTAGVSLMPGGSDWQVISDRNAKRNIRRVDGQEILDRLSRIPISRWSYKAQADDIEHIGPMAQDFYAAFGLGGDDKKISTLDPAGVALAAIQELHRKTQQLSTQADEIDDLNKRINELEALVQELAAQNRE